MGGSRIRVICADGDAIKGSFGKLMLDTIAENLKFLQSLPIEWRDVALVSCMAISWFAAFAALVAMRRAQRQASLTREWYQQLNRDLQIASSAAVGMGKRIISLERKLADQPVASVTSTQARSPVNRTQPQLVPQATAETQWLRQQASQMSNTIAAIANDAKKPATVSQAVPKPSLAVVSGNPVQQGLVAIKTEYPPLSQTVQARKTSDKANSNSQSKSSAKVKSKHKSVPAVKPMPLSPFEQAEKLLIAGIDPGEVAKRCGLTKSEAALMQLVLRQQREAAVG